jgi:hypothetical protein
MDPLDRKKFKAHSFAEASKYNNISSASVAERIKEAYLLTLSIYGYSEKNQPRLERNIFSMRKQERI